jgi:hypothetical protein
MPVESEQYTTGAPEILRGRARIEGARISARLVLGYLTLRKTAKVSLRSRFRAIAKSPPDSWSVCGDTWSCILTWKRCRVESASCAGGYNDWAC